MSTPVSTTPTTTSREPTVVSHAMSASMSASGVPGVPPTVWPLFRSPPEQVEVRVVRGGERGAPDVRLGVRDVVGALERGD
jgi:hypothetical protein